MALLKMTRASGHALNLPPHAIRTIESVRKGKNKEHPEARTFIRYDLGSGPAQALLSDEFEGLRGRLAKLHPPSADWVSFSVWQAGTRDLKPKDRDVIYLPASALIAVEGLDPEAAANDGGVSLIHVSIGGMGMGGGAIRLASFDSPEYITGLIEGEGDEDDDAADVPDPLRQPSRAERLAAPTKPGGPLRRPKPTKARPDELPATVSRPAKSAKPAAPRKPKS